MCVTETLVRGDRLYQQIGTDGPDDAVRFSVLCSDTLCCVGRLSTRAAIGGDDEAEGRAGAGAAEVSGAHGPADGAGGRQPQRTRGREGEPSKSPPLHSTRQFASLSSILSQFLQSWSDNSDTRSSACSRLQCGPVSTVRLLVGVLSTAGLSACRPNRSSPVWLLHYRKNSIPCITSRSWPLPLSSYSDYAQP